MKKAFNYREINEIQKKTFLGSDPHLLFFMLTMIGLHFVSVNCSIGSSIGIFDFHCVQ